MLNCLNVPTQKLCLCLVCMFWIFWDYDKSCSGHEDDKALPLESKEKYTFTEIYLESELIRNYYNISQ